MHAHGIAAQAKAGARPGKQKAKKKAKGLKKTQRMGVN
jgi:hypothetical protein